MLLLNFFILLLIVREDFGVFLPRKLFMHIQNIGAHSLPAGSALAANTPTTLGSTVGNAWGGFISY
jgi:hypothetical protein